jgi:hypoxanthine phosphoribosyltransferase
MTLDLTWTDVEKYVHQMSQVLDPKSYENGIMTVTRGGLVPTAMLTHLLPVRRIETICLRSYGDREQTTFEMLNVPNLNTMGGTGWLVLDDIADTGKSFRYIKSWLPSAAFCSLVMKPMADNVVDEYALKVEQDTWVVFPWEKD